MRANLFDGTFYVLLNQNNVVCFNLIINIDIHLFKVIVESIIDVF